MNKFRSSILIKTPICTSRPGTFDIRFKQLLRSFDNNLINSSRLKILKFKEFLEPREITFTLPNIISAYPATLDRVKKITTILITFNILSFLKG